MEASENVASVLRVMREEQGSRWSLREEKTPGRIWDLAWSAQGLHQKLSLDLVTRVRTFRTVVRWQMVVGL